MTVSWHSFTPNPPGRVAPIRIEEGDRIEKVDGVKRRVLGDVPLVVDLATRKRR